MTYEANETGIETARPAEVFEITAGAQQFFYTSSESIETIGGQDYTPIPGLRRSKIEGGSDRRESDFTIEMPTTNEVAQLFVGVLPGYRVRLKAKRFHRDDLPTPEVQQIFDGFVQGALFKNKAKVTVLTARVELASVGRQVPRRTYGSACNHVLYETATCKVDDTDPAFRASSLSVMSLTGNVLTVTAGLFGTYADGFMNGGFVEAIAETDFRLIRVQVGNVLTLNQPFSVTPASVNVFAGCGHSIAVCKSKFDNVDRFGGFAFVPTRNLFQTGI